jgi:ParB family chromosome partitioning protein
VNVVSAKNNDNGKGRMRNMRGLGRGLAALIPDDLVSDAPISEGERIVEASLAEIVPNPEQPRIAFCEEKLRELSQSIAEHGVLQPLIVRRGENGGYILIAGERRFRASGLAGLKKVPVVVRDYMDSAIQLELALVENLQREDLNPIDGAKGYLRLVEKYGYTQEQVASKVGKDRATVANSMRLLKLPDEVLELISNGRLTAGHGKALLGVSKKSDLRRFVAQVLNGGLSVRATERLVKSLSPSSRRAAPERQRDKVLAYASDMLTRSLATQVKISGRTSGGGKIVIDYHSDEDLERLMEHLRNDHE